MNRIQFSFPPRKLDIRKLMAPPKDITNVEKWIRSARKLIPQIPDVTSHTGWYIHDELIDGKYITILFQSTTGERCTLVMCRKSAMEMGDKY